MADLVVSSLVKRFGAFEAIGGIDFRVEDGEFFSLLGPSGCGKSTTLNILAGLERPDEGRITSGSSVLFDQKAKTFLQPEERNFGLVFQSYALWPHLTVEENIAFPLRLRRVPAAERKARIRETLELVEMADLMGRYPHELSGGQQQRVALARTLVYQPSVLLLDEPLSNLDAKLRDRARIWLSELQRRLKLTTIFVTHDQAEALALSDRIAVMNGGAIVQIGTPVEIYRNPTDPFVADFIGTSSFLDGVLADTEANGFARVALDNGQTLLAVAPRKRPASGRVTVAIRPENVVVRPAGQAPVGEAGSLLSANVVSKTYGGAHYNYVLHVGSSALRTESRDDLIKDDVSVWIPASGALSFAA